MVKSSELAGGLVDVAVLTVAYLAFHQDPVGMRDIFIGTLFSIVAARAALLRDQLGKKNPPPPGTKATVVEVVKNSATLVLLAIIGTSILHWLTAHRQSA